MAIRIMLIYNDHVRRLHTHSQNFLRDPKLVRTLVGHSNLNKDDTVYDIGAGSGIITSVVAGYVKEVIAIEYDERMIPKLRNNTQQKKNVTIIHADIVAFEFPDQNYKVFANIPFHLSSPILRKLSECDSPPQGDIPDHPKAVRPKTTHRIDAIYRFAGRPYCTAF